jgi:hypothetical protein
VLAAAALLTLGGCSSSMDQVLGTCVREEERALIPLTALAEKTMQGVPHSLTESQSCVGDGLLAPYVEAEAFKWHERSKAERHLTRLGWSKESLTHYRSPDGAWDASVVRETNDNEVIALILRFQKAHS